MEVDAVIWHLPGATLMLLQANLEIILTYFFQVDRPRNLADKLIGLGKSGQGIKISRALANAMENTTDYIGIQVRQIYGCNKLQLIF